MTSEVVQKSAAEREWITRKDRIGEKLGEIVESVRKTLLEMEPDIRAIRDKKLWEHGGYDSFEQFCNKGLGVTKQRIYQILSDSTALKSLEISKTESNNLTTPPENVAIIEPPETPKKRKPRPEPEPTEATPIPARELDLLDEEHTKPEAPIIVKIPLLAYDWIRLVDALNSPELMDLRAVIHGCAERAGVVIP